MNVKFYMFESSFKTPQLQFWTKIWHGNRLYYYPGFYSKKNPRFEKPQN